MHRPNRRSGYTLLEVLLVMAILIIITAVSLPSLDAMYGDLSYRVIERAVHIHPTVSELIPTLLANLVPLQS